MSLIMTVILTAGIALLIQIYFEEIKAFIKKLFSKDEDDVE